MSCTELRAQAAVYLELYLYTRVCDDTRFSMSRTPPNFGRRPQSITHALQ